MLFACSHSTDFIIVIFHLLFIWCHIETLLDQFTRNYLGASKSRCGSCCLDRPFLQPLFSVNQLLSLTVFIYPLSWRIQQFFEQLRLNWPLFINFLLYQAPTLCLNIFRYLRLNRNGSNVQRLCEVLRKFSFKLHGIFSCVIEN